ncbi:MAG: hypothetical protein RDU13_12520 [Elusimicrobiales bacterium]|nr:hypothetical protein [Elusimicrobiales bacterium]
MKCLDDLEMTDLVSGNMPGPESAAAEEHLRDCAVCRAEYSALSTAARSAAAAPPAPLPEDFTARLMTRLDEERPAAGLISRLLPSPPAKKLAFALAASMVIAAALLQRHTGPSLQVDPPLILTDRPLTFAQPPDAGRSSRDEELFLSDRCLMVNCGL